MGGARAVVEEALPPGGASDEAPVYVYVADTLAVRGLRGKVLKPEAPCSRVWSAAAAAAACACRAGGKLPCARPSAAAKQGSAEAGAEAHAALQRCHEALKEVRGCAASGPLVQQAAVACSPRPLPAWAAPARLCRFGFAHQTFPTRMALPLLPCRRCRAFRFLTRVAWLPAPSAGAWDAAPADAAGVRACIQIQACRPGIACWR